MSETKNLHFSIGPVQGFVAKARRTRDYFSGSFLLSYLAGKAILAVIDGGGVIDFPFVHQGKSLLDDLLLSIRERRPGTAVGSLPNRFQAQIPADFSPDRCTQAVRSAWKGIADVVWNQFIAQAEPYGRATRRIWDRQIEGFWDISWVVGPDGDASILDRRKNWRSFIPTIEPGDKCHLMGNLQEISGYIRSKEMEQQDAFWDIIRAKVGNEIQRNERLSAVALVKRLFPLVAKEAIGWELPESFPSTLDFAAAHWLTETLVLSNSTSDLKQAGRGLLEVAREHYGIRGRGYEPLSCVKRAAEDSTLAELAKVDPNFLYKTRLANDHLWMPDSKGWRQTAEEHLAKIYQKKGGEPHPFFALLMMDGDGMGAILNDFAEQRHLVSKAVSEFTRQVSQIVERHNGRTIYAGGDDVLALFPLEDALAGAFELRQTYRGVFQQYRQVQPDARASNQLSLAERGTISGAIVYAHYATPLKSVITAAHELLDRMAKDFTGRDSIALQVWKPSGTSLKWAVPWGVLKAYPARIGCASSSKVRSSVLDDLIEFFSDKGGQERGFSSQFFYKMKEDFARFSPLFVDETIENDHFLMLLTAELMKSRERPDLNLDEARCWLQKLLYVCRVWRRTADGTLVAGPLNADPAMIIRFLAQKGGEMGK